MAAANRDLAIRDELIVEAEIAGEHVALPAFVTNVLPEALWLVLRNPDLSPICTLQPGQPIHLAFLRDGTQFVAASSFVRRLGGDRLGTEKSRVFAVARPVEIEQAERRAHVRVDIERTVYIKVPAPIVGGEALVRRAKTTNVSAGGIQVLSDLPLVVGDQVKVALVLRANDVVTVAAQAVRLEETGELGPDGTPVNRIAMRFEHISEADQERIACHILAERRRRPKQTPSIAVRPAGSPVVDPAPEA